MVQGGKVYICDDEEEMRRYLRKILHSHGFTVETFAGGGALLERLEREENGAPDILLQDIRMPELDGIEVLKRVRKLRPSLPVVIMTGYGTIDSAVEAIKLGAYDYITKPFPKEKILGVMVKALEREFLLSENRGLKEELCRQSSPGEIVFASEKFRDAFELTLQVAGSDANIVIRGESGTGKELIARAIHHNSPRRSCRFLSVNCAALSDTLLESQLFGHVRGAFTGAVTSQKGLLEESSEGTLFLDEIGDISPSLQAKLLRVIQEREFLAVGSTRPKSVDVRFVAATNKDLEREVKAGRFREDLYYRLHVISINLPPLRERKEDIVPLAEHFLAKYARRTRKRVSGITGDALRLLAGYDWPGNVRELENVIERAVILARGERLTAELFPVRNSADAPAPHSETEATSLESAERAHIMKILGKSGFHRTRAAEVLGITRKTLSRKIAEYAIELPCDTSDDD
ncbi:sigma-54-dependent transcriptional regulator [Geotalea uraniireducens]|uniref:DNA-binding transcriptional regulator NtrC n=1 Tax=Geotalea uraniireducens (strain Rf4) TaxID=351605 RepID=A5G6W4_GEOUR|nr:two component, sigma-54 specific, transcriptional regulator, Fis family [Geotalea uraniireducens Rf4]